MKPEKPNRTTPTKRAMRGASRKNDGALPWEADRPERLGAGIMELEVELRSRDQAASDARAELAKAMATSEILRTISRSPTGVQPIFESVVSSVARLCDATDVRLVLVEDNAQRVTAWMGPFFEEWRALSSVGSGQTGADVRRCRAASGCARAISTNLRPGPLPWPEPGQNMEIRTS